MGNREQAKRLMVHYLMLAVKANGGQWTGDNSAEVETLVDCLIDAAKEEIEERLDRLENPSEYDALMLAETAERARRR